MGKAFNSSISPVDTNKKHLEEDEKRMRRGISEKCCHH